MYVQCIHIRRSVSIYILLLLLMSNQQDIKLLLAVLDQSDYEHLKIIHTLII